MMPVDSSGTFIRDRGDAKGDIPRPEGIHIEFWKQMSREEKLAEVRKAKAATASAGPECDACHSYRTFNTKYPFRYHSTFPPWEAPPPNAIVRRIVTIEDGGRVVENEDTTDWDGVWM